MTVAFKKTQHLGFEAAGVKVNANGAITVNHFLQTKKAHIYAVGDVADLPVRAEPTAGREGTLAAENTLGGSTQSIDYGAVPFTVFTDWLRTPES